MTIHKTTEYDKFVLREDNRKHGLMENHVLDIMESLKIRNLLHLRPIVINTRNEVLDGQHRLEAAKRLGLPIYYMLDKDSQSEDLIHLNMSKKWNTDDYLNFWCKQGKQNYIKLAELQRKTGLNISILLNLCCMQTGQKYRDFKMGKLEGFEEGKFEQSIEYCRETSDLFVSLIGFHTWYRAKRFCIPLCKLCSNENFKMEKWRENLQKLSHKLCQKATTQGYEAMLEDIYNWHNSKKIHLREREYVGD